MSSIVSAHDLARSADYGRQLLGSDRRHGVKSKRRIPPLHTANIPNTSFVAAVITLVNSSAGVSFGSRRCGGLILPIRERIRRANLLGIVHTTVDSSDSS